MEYEKPKFGTRKWFENYWYHYKWHTAAGAFFLVILIVFISDLLTREKYDVQIPIHAGVYITSEQQARLEELLAASAEDYDGDGKINVGVFPNYFSDGEQNSQMYMAAQIKFMAEMSDDTSMILIMDQWTYDQIGDPAFFADLSSMSAGTLAGGTQVPLSATAMGKDPLIEPVADQLFFTMRAPDSYLVTKNEKTLAHYEQEKIFLETVLSAG